MKYQFKEYKKSTIQRNHLNLGGENPKGERIDVTSLYLEKNKKPWIGVMGEFHFSRYQKKDWYHELCKMKAGGITIVATYMFWIYHEEIEGEFDFSENLDIRTFIEACEKAGLYVWLRIGPWAHGECRNGGFPDWLLKKPYPLRENHPEYMEKAKIWYQKIYEQVAGKFYKDGGNIVGVQLENELTEGAEHLLALKELAKEIGFEVPIYTVTGWNRAQGAKIPVDEVLPVFGAYPEAPWADTIEKLPLSPHYVFSTIRNDSAVGIDLIEEAKKDDWKLPYEKFPFATCELGAGMQITHHRRPIITGMDAYALALTKLGSGNNLVGYYMYHGGSNRIGKLSTFNESKMTGYPNDYPMISYDFQAPLSEYGEVRESYRLLNMLNLFVTDFGHQLAPMEAVLSEKEVSSEDLQSLRYALRTDGSSGFVFVNHYQRLATLEDVKGAQIDTGKVLFPAIDVCAETSFFFPYGMKMDEKTILEYVTAQPLCKVGNTFFFVQIEGIQAEYKFADGKRVVPATGLQSMFTINELQMVTLSLEQARYARKLKETLYIGKECDLYEADGDILSVQEGNYGYFVWNGDAFEEKEVERASVKAEIVFTNLEEAPMDVDYLTELQLGSPRKVKWMEVEVSNKEGFVEIPFVCDVAQLYADERLIADEYYYGKAWRIPAKLLYGKKCYLALSEMKDDFYREFGRE